MKDLQIGTKVSSKRKFSNQDLELFARLTGDYNPIHFDMEYAANTIFKRPIVHGPLVITLVTTLFAKDLPGPGAVYLSHDVKYLRPVYVDEEVTAILEVVDINEKRHILIKTTCTNSKGEVVLDGIARLKKF